MAYKRNEGRLPPCCVIEDEDDNVRHRSVHVRLFGGYDTRKRGDAPWPSGGGRPPTRWAISKTPHPFEIEEFEVA